MIEVLDPISWEFWDETFVTYSQEWDDVIIDEGYLQDQLKKFKIEVHPKTQRIFDELRI